MISKHEYASPNSSDLSQPEPAQRLWLFSPTITSPWKRACYYTTDWQKNAISDKEGAQIQFDRYSILWYTIDCNLSTKG